jgi:hypothetical protein
VVWVLVRVRTAVAGKVSTFVRVVVISSTEVVVVTTPTTSVVTEVVVVGKVTVPCFSVAVIVDVSLIVVLNTVFLVTEVSRVVAVVVVVTVLEVRSIVEVVAVETVVRVVTVLVVSPRNSVQNAPPLLARRSCTTAVSPAQDRFLLAGKDETRPMRIEMHTKLSRNNILSSQSEAETPC